MMSNSIVRSTPSNRQTSPDERPISLRELKEAADKHLVAMLCNVGQAYSPVTTWLYVARDETGRLYFAKRGTGGREEDVELTRRLTEMVRRGGG